MRGCIVLKNLPCLACLLANASAYRPVARFYYELTGLIRNHDVTLTWHFKDDSRRQFRFFCYVTNQGGSEAYYGDEQTYDLRNHEGVYSSTFTIPKAYTDVETLHLFFGAVSTTSDSWSDMVYEDQKLGKTIRVNNITDTSVYYCGRKVVESDIYGSHDYSPYYYIDYMHEGVFSNSICLENWRIRLEDEYGKAYPITCTANIYLLDHVQEWKIGHIRGKGNSAYVVVPLQLSWDEQGQQYEFLTKEEFVFNRKTGLMSRKDAVTESESTFRTHRIFAPGYSKDESRQFRYEIHLTNVNEGDQFTLKRTAETGKMHFGSCSDADYCIAIGGS